MNEKPKNRNDVSSPPVVVGEEVGSNSVVGRSPRVAQKHRERFLHTATMTWLLGVLMVVILAPLPLWLQSGRIGTISLSMLFIILALSLNLCFGFAGEFVLSFPVIMGAGAYLTTVCSAVFHMSFALSVLLGVIGATAVSTLLTLPGLRIRGFYLAIIGLFSVVVFPDFINLFQRWTQGENGLAGIVTPQIFGRYIGFQFWYECALILLALYLVFTTLLLRSSWGLRIRALRDARQAGMSVGLNGVTTRLIIFFISAVPAALAGAIYAYQQQFVIATSFNINLALVTLAGVIIGGKGTVLGPLVGMVPLLVFQFWVGQFSPWSPVVYGCVLLASVIIFPDGLVPLAHRLVRGGNRFATSDVVTEVATFRSSEQRSWTSTTEEDSTAPGLALQVIGVMKSFFGTTALSDVNFEIERGSIVGLVGPNGSGKSTLLSVITGYIASDKGHVMMPNGEVTGRSPHRIAAAGVGRTFQVPQLIEDCTVLENIKLGLISQEGIWGMAPEFLRFPAARRRSRDRDERAREVGLLLGLPPELNDVTASNLPLGLKRIVEVGRAIVRQPELLLLDEPTAGLNEAERDAIGRVIQQLRALGVTAIIVEHSVSFVLKYCSEVMLLDQGHIVSRGSTGADLSPELIAYMSYGVGI